jgi:hypothetical protein
MQPYLINSLDEEFEKEVINFSDYGTLLTPQFKIERPNDWIRWTHQQAKEKTLGE